MGKQNRGVIPRGLEQGDLVLVYWLDIVGEVTDDPKKAELAPCIDCGYFMELKSSVGKKSLVVAKCFTPAPPQGEQGLKEHWGGSDIYPMSVVVKVELLRKKKDVKWPT